MNYKSLLFTLLLVATISCIKKQSEINLMSEKPVVFYRSHEPKKADLPFSDIVQVENTFYLSGQIGINHATRNLVEGGIEAETIQTLENIKEVLAHHDLKMNEVVKCLVILEDLEDFPIINKAFEDYFPQKPARTTFAAKALAKNAKVEIEVIAVKIN